MRVRHTHKVGKRTYKMVYRTAYDEVGVAKDGLADHANRRIIIAPRLRKDRSEHDRTLWHELLHTMNWEYGLAMGHLTIERLSIALANYCDDNGLDFPEPVRKKA